MIKGVHITYFTPRADEMRAFMRDKLKLAYTDVGGGWLIFNVPHTEMAPHPFDPTQSWVGGVFDATQTLTPANLQYLHQFQLYQQQQLQLQQQRQGLMDQRHLIDATICLTEQQQQMQAVTPKYPGRKRS